MKQPIWILAAFALLIMSCGRKNLPAKTTHVGTTNKPVIKDADNKIKETINIPETKEKEEKTDTKKTATETLLPMVVIDGMGNVITPKEKLPEEIAAKADYKILSRAFTPNQRTNLIYRYKIVPPRILFVPDNYIKTTARGKYVVYRKKFWYWQKEDGLFYLDETYYK
ncbi:hypothetical protein [Sediminibacterium goheungense]|uniref:Lipoprotein n=1 Tax=Sediminibacterium goheungense TaxID=1086393 RepID=A0A4R6IWV0_9BACT|nr:hypothetical protein [Sediminibacterium goheungense]TDO26841.1 hypothetical protein BC659_2153 [Sediminibacterium goheungense]